jgi:hypothetical protein
MKFNRNNSLTTEERQALIFGLNTVAEEYFTDMKTAETGCGICFALYKKQIPFAGYSAMSNLTEELEEENFGPYTDTPEDWEPRANMCLFLAEYLKDTVQ